MTRLADNGNYASRKRPTFTSSNPHPPPPLLATYTPLLLQLARAHPTLFPSLLARRLASSLAVEPNPDPSAAAEPKARSRSDEASRCAWLVWTVECLVPDNATGQDARPVLVGQIAREAFGSGRPLRAVLAALAGRHPASLGLQLRAVLRVLGDISLDDVVAAPDAAMADADDTGLGAAVATDPSTAPPPPSRAGALSGLAPIARASNIAASGGKARLSPKATEPCLPPSSASGTEMADELRAAEAGWTRVPEQAWSIRPMGVRVGE